MLGVTAFEYLSCRYLLSFAIGRNVYYLETLRSWRHLEKIFLKKRESKLIKNLFSFQTVLLK